MYKWCNQVLLLKYSSIPLLTYYPVCHPSLSFLIVRHISIVSLHLTKHIYTQFQDCLPGCPLLVSLCFHFLYLYYQIYVYPLCTPSLNKFLLCHIWQTSAVHLLKLLLPFNLDAAHLSCTYLLSQYCFPHKSMNLTISSSHICSTRALIVILL